MASSSPDFLDRIVDFPDGASYKLLDPLTDYRACHDGTPLEARIVYTCRRVDSDNDVEAVVKIKVQLPGISGTDRWKPEEGPSSTTAQEFKALEIFRKADSTYAPHLLGFKRGVQGDKFPLPGGYITYTLMSKVPGETLFNHYWSLPEEERQDLAQKFLGALRCV